MGYIYIYIYINIYIIWVLSKKRRYCRFSADTANYDIFPVGQKEVSNIRWGPPPTWAVIIPSGKFLIIDLEK